MNVLEVLIIGSILIGSLVGFKRGFTKQLISFVGFFVIIILAFILKNNISVYMYENFPFFPLNGILKGVTVLNIIIYEFIAFFLVLGILGIILKVVLMVSGLFESILKLTIILSIPSKILGAIVGMIQGYVMSFILIYLLTLPLFNVSFIKNSSVKDFVLNKTPIISNYVEDSYKIFEEFSTIKEQYVNSTNPKQFNLDTLKLLLKYQVVKVSSIEKLIDKGKVDISRTELYNIVEEE
jgi:uncharacterized membrane protein required for colicin V production